MTELFFRLEAEVSYSAVFYVPVDEAATWPEAVALLENPDYTIEPEEISIEPVTRVNKETVIMTDEHGHHYADREGNGLVIVTDDTLTVTESD